MNVLRILANPKPVEQSASLRVEQAFHEAFARKFPDASISEFHVYREDIPQIDFDTIGPFFGKPAANADIQAKMDRRKAILDQFMAADMYIFASPMWNFALPPMLKAYMDCVLIAGKTFRYTANGPIGLLKNKQAILIVASGGRYDTDLKDWDMAYRLLDHYCTWMGITDVHSIRAAGMAAAPADAEKIVVTAMEEAKQVVAAL